MRPYRTRLLLGLCCGVCFALANGALMVTVKLVVNLIFDPAGTRSLADQIQHAPALLRPFLEKWLPRLPEFNSPSSNAGKVAAILVIPAIMAVRGLFGYLNVYLTNWAAMRAIADLRARLFGHLQNLSLSFYAEARTGDLISRITSDTQTLYNLCGTALASLVKDPITVAVLFGILLSQQPRLTLICIIALPACLVPIIIYGQKVRRSARAMQNHNAELTGLMHEAFTGNRIIKAYNLEATVLEQFRRTTMKIVGQMMRVVRANELPSHVTEFLGGVGIALVFLYVVHQPDQAMTAGDFFQFVLSIVVMYQPIKSLTKMHNQVHQARAASGRLFELLDLRNNVIEPSLPKPLRAAGANIHFDNIDFSYAEKPVLRGVTLDIQPGQLVALVGQSGSGKTTLTNLLLRFYDPQRGAVRIGGLDLREVATRDLRDQIAVVTQETILFNETVRWNIAVGRPGATDEQIIAAAKHAHAHDFIMEKAGGYDALVGERGVMLSGGQRQRLAIARALLRDAPILILDEATGALDTETERAVQADFDELMRGRTTVCIAHRLSTILHADVIVVLEQGRIVETGKHEELIQRGGIYQRLYELQFRE